MAKMKVHELAKELQKQSKEILAFLQEQGIEAKAPQSTLEEDTVALVRKSFGADTGKTEEKKAAPVKEENARHRQHRQGIRAQRKLRRRKRRSLW